MKWKYDRLIQNSSFSFSDICELLNLFNIKWNNVYSLICKNINVKWNDFVSYRKQHKNDIDYDNTFWDYSELASKSDVNFNKIEKYSNKVVNRIYQETNGEYRGSYRVKYVYGLSGNPKFSFKKIQNIIGVNRHSISKNPNIDYTIVRDNPDINWNREILSSNLFLYDTNSVRYKKLKKKTIKLLSPMLYYHIPIKQLPGIIIDYVR